MQTVGEFWKIQEICYMIGTRILKIDSEIAEIIDDKVATPHFRNWYFAITQSQKKISMWQVATLTSIISAISESIFKILVPIM